nr:type 4a pilus biogenesis protein PilO [uncultured Desulfuromonas sp.]
MDPRLEKMLKLPLYQRVLLLLLVLAIIFGVYTYFYYMPTKEELAAQQAVQERVLVELQEKRRIANDLPRFKAEYEKMKKQLDLALGELPNKSEVPSLLTSVAGLARDNGLEVAEFKPGSENPKGFYAEVPVSLKLSGAYHELAFFCDAVSRLERIVNINDLVIGKPVMKEGNTVLSISNTVVTYRFIDNPSAQRKKMGGGR